MTPVHRSVTVITVNFKTPDLLRLAVTSFKRHYPRVSMVLIDNGGCGQSLAAQAELSLAFKNIRTLHNSRNIGHGPAMCQGFKLCRTDYVFTLDSDTETVKGGFLERMLECFARNENLLAVGWLRWVNKNGVAAKRKGGQHVNPYVHPYAALMNLEKYRTLTPFKHRGAPSVGTMLSAVRRGYDLESFPIEEYVKHKIAGTRGRFGGNWSPKTRQRMEPYKRKRI